MRLPLIRVQGRLNSGEKYIDLFIKHHNILIRFEHFNVSIPFIIKIIYKLYSSYSFLKKT
jgi:hypothetical protein